MIVLAIHKTTGEIHQDLQDTPESAYHEGTRALRAAEALGGSPDDYFEYIFASKDRDTIFSAKYLLWDSHKSRIKAVPYSKTERQENQRKKDKASIGHELIRAQIELDAATTLGMDTGAREANRDSLKTKYDKVKEKKTNGE